jgi:hypothetical protein
MFHLPLRLLYGLAALKEYAVIVDLGASLELDPCDLGRHGPYLVAFDMGDWKICSCRRDRDPYIISSA